jgi:hypothetical protein
MKSRELKTIRRHFVDPSSLGNPDDQSIYRLLVESGWLTEEQLEFNGSCLKETPLCRWWHREAAAKKKAREASLRR